MTKYWDIGEVKTRLGATIGMERAGRLHELFVAHLCATLSQARCRKIICLAPDDRMVDAKSALESWGVDRHWEIAPQGRGSLGERMQRWFIHNLPSESSRAILIGTDCPLLSVEHIEQANQVLHSHDVVLGPAHDGGYYLIGLAGPWASNQARIQTLFDDVPWSTNQVLPITRDRLQKAALSYAELEPREDVDTIKELDNLRASIAGSSDRDSEFKCNIDRILDGYSPPPPEGRLR